MFNKRANNNYIYKHTAWGGVMSKEIALLRRVKVLLECSNMEPLQRQTDLIIKEIQELLAQPELSTVSLQLDGEVHEEPPIPDGDTDVNHISPMTHREAYLRGYEKAVCALKREPLSDGATADMYHANKKATHPDSYWSGVYDAEKAHGITGVDDE